MIRIDDRVGAVELLPLFPEGTCQVERMEFGDLAWEGRGPEGMPWQIGVERKVIGDLINCITTNRFTDHQLPGMLNTYNFTYLVVEGLTKYESPLVEQYHYGGWKPIEYGKRQFYTNEVLGFLNTVSIMTGMRVLRTTSDKETVAHMLALHRWWTVKDFDSHRSHLAAGSKVAPLVKWSLLRHWAADLPGIGDRKSGEVAKHFESPRDMANAPVDRWLEIDGIGKTIATKVVEAIGGK